MGATPREVAESYWRAECARDIEAVMAHYHVDAEFTPAGRLLRGHAEIRTFYEDSAARFPGLECRIVHEVANGDEAALEWEAVLIDRQGVRHPLVGVNVIRVEDGKFRSVRAYFDQSTFYATQG
jgi:limonene-1,2-epoxide hydrolase